MKTPTRRQRLALQDRPMDRTPVMYQTWQDLLFLHWQADAEALQATLPPGLFIDTFEDSAFLAIVPFEMRDIRPRGLPAVPWISNFLECNVRTYVHDANGVPGVWFYSLDTDRLLAERIARTAFHLPYFWASMQSKWDAKGGIDYHLRRRSRGDDYHPEATDHPESHFQWRPHGTPRLAEPGSLEFFLLERYLLFAADPRQPDRLLRGQVHHEPYTFTDVEVTRFDTHPIAWDGLEVPTGAPVHACASPGVDVSVYAIEEVELPAGLENLTQRRELVGV